MTTYYVRKSGNDGNLGTSPAQAWLTIDNAANNVAAADTVYIGSGVYRELVTMDTSGSSGNQISFIGDIDGIQTGDAGPVILTAHDAENADPARNYSLDMGDEEFITWQYVSFVGGSIATVHSGTATDFSMDGVKFLDCTVLGVQTGSYSFNFDLNAGAVPTTTGLRIQRCSMVGTARILHNNNASAHVDIDLLIDNSLVFVGGTSTTGAVSYTHLTLPTTPYV
jgi:hypothetical protein